jgi:hypothetical protein
LVYLYISLENVIKSNLCNKLPFQPLLDDLNLVPRHRNLANFANYLWWTLVVACTIRRKKQCKKIQILGLISPPLIKRHAIPVQCIQIYVYYYYLTIQWLISSPFAAYLQSYYNTSPPIIRIKLYIWTDFVDRFKFDWY